MKKYLVTVLLSMTVAVPAMGADGPKDFEGQLSYSLGYEMGSYLKSLDAGIKSDILFNGAEMALKGEKPLMSEDEMLKVKETFAKQMQIKQVAEFEKMKADNLAAGKAFLDKNKGKKGVVLTKSGLQYEIVKEGKGPKAKPEDTVTVNYTGTLVDGTVFDSTDKHGEPAQFQVNRVIPGWTEAMQLMNPGMKMHLVIPSELAYGEQGAKPVIEPNSVLVFDVELLKVEAPAPKVEKKVEAAPVVPDVAEQAKAAVEKVEAAADKVKAAADNVKAAAE